MDKKQLSTNEEDLRAQLNEKLTKAIDKVAAERGATSDELLQNTADFLAKPPKRED